MFVIKHKLFFFAISGLLVLASLVAVFSWGLRPGVDFTGGTILEVRYAEERPEPPPLGDPRATARGDLDLDRTRLPPAPPTGRLRQAHPDRVRNDPQRRNSGLTERVNETRFSPERESSSLCRGLFLSKQPSPRASPR